MIQSYKIAKCEPTRESLERALYELERAKKYLQEAQENFSHLSSLASSVQESQSQVKMRIIDRLEDLLRKASNRDFGYEELAVILETTKNTIRTMLYKLAADSKVKRVHRGKWQIIESEQSRSNNRDEIYYF